MKRLNSGGKVSRKALPPNRPVRTSSKTFKQGFKRGFKHGGHRGRTPQPPLLDPQNMDPTLDPMQFTQEPAPDQESPVSTDQPSNEPDQQPVDSQIPEPESPEV